MTTAAPGVLANDSSLITAGESAASVSAFADSVSSSDLLQTSLSSATTSVNPAFGFGGLRDGSASLNTTNSTFFTKSQLLQNPEVTFTLDTSTNTNGYDIHSIRTIAGWNGVNQTQANQKYELFTRQVGSTSFVSHGVFEESPFSPVPPPPPPPASLQPTPRE